MADVGSVQIKEQRYIASSGIRLNQYYKIVAVKFMVIANEREWGEEDVAEKSTGHLRQ